MMFFFVLTVLGIAWWDAPRLIRAKYWYELRIFSVLLLASLIIGILQIRGVPMPSLTKWLYDITNM
jgi:hypothetical protein